MKLYVELGLAALMSVLVYEKPKFLTNTVNTTLGKISMILTVGLLAKQFGINAGLLAAIIMVLLLESQTESFELPLDLSKGMKIKNTVGSDIGEECSTDKDCAPCKKKCKTKLDASGKPEMCACGSSCTGGKCTATEGFDLRPSSFPVTGTHRIGLSRMLKINALNSKMSASQQANGCTNNGGGIAY